MKANRMSRSALTWALALAAGPTFLAACGDQADLETGQVSTEQTALLAMSTGTYNTGTQCTVGGITMHCCPGNQVGDPLIPSFMVGAKLNSNTFKCVGTNAESFGPVFLDGPDAGLTTVRNGMHACPRNSIMVGFRGDKNDLACRSVIGRTLSETVDAHGHTQDSLPMHVCPSTASTPPLVNVSAMSGINEGNNDFLCAL